jgi:hypothetical protein
VYLILHHVLHQIQIHISVSAQDWLPHPLARVSDNLDLDGTLATDLEDKGEVDWWREVRGSANQRQASVMNDGRHLIFQRVAA